MDFHFLVMKKSSKINVEKEGAPCLSVCISTHRSCVLTSPGYLRNSAWERNTIYGVGVRRQTSYVHYVHAAAKFGAKTHRGMKILEVDRTPTQGGGAGPQKTDGSSLQG